MRKSMFLIILFVSTEIVYAQGATSPESSPAMSQHFGHDTPTLSPLLDLEHRTFEVRPHGHWTLIYFWADWCIPCIEKGIPDLIAFANAHEAERKRFQIVAIRFGSIHEDYDWTTFRTKTLHLEQEVWHQVPPFPVVDDDSSKFSTDWGIHALPTYALINPKGNLVRDGNLRMLEEALIVRK